MPRHPASAPLSTAHPSLDGFSATELRAMSMCGEAIRLSIGIAELYLPADTAIGPGERAELLAGYVRPALIVVRSTARWLLVGGPVPDRVEVSARRGRYRPRPLLVRRHLRIGADEWSRIGSIAVTTPHRTYRDLSDAGLDAQARLLVRRCPELAQPLCTR